MFIGRLVKNLLLPQHFFGRSAARRDSSEPLRQRLKEQAQFLAGLVQRWNFLFNPGPSQIVYIPFPTHRCASSFLLCNLANCVLNLMLIFKNTNKLFQSDLWIIFSSWLLLFIKVCVYRQFSGEGNLDTN